MLRVLRVRELAIIDELELSLGEGLNIVTGETGAGKSILVDALQLVVGGRARPELVRSGAVRAEVEALFELSEPEAAAARESGIEVSAGELLVRRIIEAEGRSRVYIDGRLGTATQLAAVTSRLVDISSQHEHHSLVDPATHLGFLDAFAGLGHERLAMNEAWNRLAAAEAELARVQSSLREDRADWLRFQLTELDRVPDLAGDEAELSRLRNVDALGAIVSRVEERLYTGDNALCGSLSRLASELEATLRFDESLSPNVDRLRSATTEIEDVASELGKYSRGLRRDPSRLTALEESVHEVRRLRRKHGDDLPAARKRIADELVHFERAGDALAAAEVSIAAAKKEVDRLVPMLRHRRESEATRLATGITGELASLGMGEAKVEVDVSPAGVGPRGADRVEFLIATNRGEEPRPLRKVASGGELSRALLAVKRVLAAEGPAGAYVFDEVDTGVGGAIAEVIGGKLHAVSRHHQVICITHLPQIAAWADAHLHVSKSAAGGRTVSSVRRLSEPESIEEIARMLGGVRVSEAARSAARELRDGARLQSGARDPSAFHPPVG